VINLLQDEIPPQNLNRQVAVSSAYPPITKLSINLVFPIKIAIEIMALPLTETTSSSES
jgi:hypothetical protein